MVIYQSNQINSGELLDLLKLMSDKSVLAKSFLTVSEVDIWIKKSLNILNYKTFKDQCSPFRLSGTCGRYF